MCIRDRDEVERILTELTAMVAPYGNDIYEALLLIGEIDLRFAKAALARDMRAVRPEMNAQGSIRIVRGRQMCIRDRSIGYVKGTPSETALKSYAGANPDKGISTSVFASYPDMLAALDKGVVDGISLTGTHYIKYREEHGLNIHGTMLGTVNYAIASSTDSPAPVSYTHLDVYKRQGWSSGSITWNNKPLYSGTYVSNTAYNDGGEWYAMDVYSAVSGWLKGTFSNYGLSLIHI